MKKTIYIIAFLLIFAVLAVLINPTLRAGLLGEDLSRPLTVAKDEQLVFFIDAGQSEIIQDGDQPIPDFDSVPFNREQNGQIGVYEDRVLSPQEDSLTCTYRLGSLKSETFNPQAEENIDLSFSCIVPEQGTIEPLPLEIIPSSILEEDSILHPLFSLLWPDIPSQRLAVPSKPWKSIIRFSIPHGPRAGGIHVQYTMEFKVIDKLIEQGKEVFQVGYEGLFELQPNQDIEAQTYGFIHGHLLIDSHNRECIGGEYRSNAQLVFPNGELPTYIWTELAGVRYVRIQK